MTYPSKLSLKVYGIATDSYEFAILSWDGKSCLCSHDTEFRSRYHYAPREEEAKKLKNNTSLFVKMITSILINQLDVEEAAAGPQTGQQPEKRFAIEEEQVKTTAW